MKDTFELKNVTILIDQTLLEREKDEYWLRSINPESPLSVWGKPFEIGQLFGIWLNNTVSAMKKNNCKLIKMDISWE